MTMSSPRSPERQSQRKPEADASHTGDEFYVGYLPISRSQRSTLRLIVPAIVLIFGGAIALLASVQRDPGSGVWREEVAEFTGTVFAQPAPMLLIAGESEDRVALLVEEGKHGAGPRVAEWDGKRVTVRGRALEREGGMMMELVAGNDAVRAAEGVVMTQRSVASGEATFRGEIVDAKCYHGAMKPGDGKGHKACATLCIRNGIPPMLATADGSGGVWLRLLIVSGGMDSDTLAKVGEPVEFRGEMSRVANLDIITIEPGSVRRIAR